MNNTFLHRGRPPRQNPQPSLCVFCQQWGRKRLSPCQRHQRYRGPGIHEDPRQGLVSSPVECHINHGDASVLGQRGFLARGWYSCPSDHMPVTRLLFFFFLSETFLVLSSLLSTSFLSPSLPFRILLPSCCPSVSSFLFLFFFSFFLFCHAYKASG